MSINATTTQNTWLPTLLSGLTLITFGAFILFWQRRTLFSMEMIFSAFLLVEGVFHIIKGVMAPLRDNDENTDERNRDSTWMLNTILGLGQILVGIYILWDPSMTTTKLLTTFGVYLLVKGAYDILFSVMAKMDRNSRMYFLVLGIITLIAGIGALSKPDISSLRFAMFLGTYGIAAGALASGLAYRLRDRNYDDLDTDTEEVRKFKVKTNINPAL